MARWLILKSKALRNKIATFGKDQAQIYIFLSKIALNPFHPTAESSLLNQFGFDGHHLEYFRRRFGKYRIFYQIYNLGNKHIITIKEIAIKKNINDELF